MVTRAAAPRISGRIRIRRVRLPGTTMNWKVRALTGALMTLVICVIVTFVATLLAVGFDPAFLRQWAKAFVVAWPIAAITAFFVLPGARRIAERLAGL
jgi:hypothetical protein